VTLHHLVPEVAIDLFVSLCQYCSEEVEPKSWETEWHGEHHYKVFTCPECFKENFVSIDFLCSGHDGIENTLN